MRSRSARLNPVIAVEPTENRTPHIAKIAEKDYILNGSRARAESGEFVPPRWIPDLAMANCSGCRSEFDWINRRHHCRHCGQIFCERCASQRLLLPPEFGYRDPERVCFRCYDELCPLQGYFSSNIANHQRSNNVDVASDTCNVRRYFNMPMATTLGSEIRKAAYTVYNLLAPQTIRDKAIPLRLIREAKGLAFLTIFKGGFGVGAKFGTGLVIARLPREQGGGWSAPSAIGVMGVTWGFMIGADLTDTLIVLNTDEAVRAFAGNAQVTIGADIEVAVGMVGRSGAAEVHVADTQTLAPAFSYSQAKGLYAGVSLDGSVLVTRNEVNHRFYGRPIDAQQLLSGELPAPRAAAPLYNALAEALCAVPDVAHRAPSPLTHPTPPPPPPALHASRPLPPPPPPPLPSQTTSSDSGGGLAELWSSFVADFFATQPTPTPTVSQHSAAFASPTFFGPGGYAGYEGVLPDAAPEQSRHRDYPARYAS